MYKLIVAFWGLLWLAMPCVGSPGDPTGTSLFSRRMDRRLFADEQSESEEESFFTLANTFNSSVDQDSMTLQALAGVLKSPSWFEDFETCWQRTNGSTVTYVESENCTKILAKCMAQLGNAVITNVSTASEFCNRTIQAKVLIPMLVDTPTSMAGTYMYLLHKLNKTSRIITSMWLTPIPKTRAGLLDECGAPYKGPNVGAPPAPDAEGSSESAEKKYAPQPNPPITGSIIENAGKKYRSGLAIKEQTTDWMNVELGVKSSNGLSVGMIFPRNTMLLMYRKDWFDEWGIQPPQTWSEMLSLAAQLSRMPQFIKTVGTNTGAGLTNWDQPVDLSTGDVPLAKFLKDNPIASNDTFQAWPAEGAVPMVFHQYNYHGSSNKGAQTSSSRRSLLQLSGNATQKLIPLCLDLAPYCKAGDFLAAISASIIQSQGTQQGYALDPSTLDPLTTNPGFKTAMAIYRELVALSLPASYLYQYQPLKSCAGVSRPFARGECAMTLDWDVVWPLVHKMNIPEIDAQKQLYGNVGYAPLPGSGAVWNRVTNQMEQCTKSLCPWSTSEFIPRYSYTPPVNSINTDVNPTNRTQTASFIQTNLQSTMEQVVVSRAPFSALVIREGWLCQPEGFTNNTDFILAVIDTAQKTTTEIRKSTTAMLKNVFLKVMQRRQGGADTTTPAATTPTPAATTPTDQAASAPSPSLGRRLRSADEAQHSHQRRKLSAVTSSWMMRSWDPISQLTHELGNLYGPPPIEDLSTQTQELIDALKEKPNLVAANISDVNRLLAALWKAQFTYSANGASQTVLTPSISGLFIQAYHEAAYFLATADNATLDNTGAGLSDRMRFTMSLENGGASALATALWQVTGYQAPPSPPPPAVAPVSIVVNQEDNKATITTIAIAVPTISVALIVIISAAMIVHARRNSHLSWKGDVLPPGAGSGTTLLLTDIQDSTPIWEALPPATVDEALAVHHSTIRAVALKHHGYECSTEGDSFTLAFHNAQSAALFAVEAQQELLLARWPKEVFEMEVCKPVWVKPQVKGNKPGRWQMKKAAQHDETDEQNQAAGDGSSNHSSWWNCFGQKRVATEAADAEDANKPSNAAAAPVVFINQLDEPFYVPGSSPLEWNSLTSRLSLSDDDLQTSNSITAPGDEPGVVEENEEMFIRDKLLQLAPMAPQPGEGCILLFRGLRVRMGMASGVEKTEDITLNTSLGRVCYGGALAAAAKAVQDAAQGAQVLVASSTFSQLPLQDMREQIVAMEMGWHKLSDIQEPLHLTQLLLPNLIFRAAHFGPVRSISQESLGSTQAPYGKVAVANMNIVGLGLLKSQDAELADASMRVFQQVSESYLARLGGYLQMSSDGLCLTAFSHPAEAVRWALDTIKACLEADWPEALLEHEMGEVLKVPIMAPHLLQQAEYLAETPRTPVRSSFAMGHRTSRTIGVRTSVPLELNDRGSPINTGSRPAFMTPAKIGPATPTTTDGIHIRVPAEDDNFDERNTFTDLLKMKGKDKANASSWPVVVHKVVLRGLRMKCGIDYGPVKSGIHGLSARSTYTGKVLNRAARVSQNAKTGQVWLTEAAWNAARNEVNVVPEVFDDQPPPPPAPEVAATHLGAFKLKGVPDDIHLVQCFFCDSPAPGL